MGVRPGDKVRLMKKHPCGSDEWLVVKTGEEINLECVGCGHGITMDIGVLERRIRPASFAQSKKKTN